MALQGRTFLNKALLRYGRGESCACICIDYGIGSREEEKDCIYRESLAIAFRYASTYHPCHPLPILPPTGTTDHRTSNRMKFQAQLGKVICA